MFRSSGFNDRPACEVTIPPLTSVNVSKHALAVEAVMARFARKAGEDEEVWGVAGLLHDLDYEKFPEEHCKKAEEIMRERDIDEIYIRAMKCHGYGICTDTKPESQMEKVLFTVDELTGLINAACSCGLPKVYWIWR